MSTLSRLAASASLILLIGCSAAPPTPTAPPPVATAPPKVITQAPGTPLAPPPTKPSGAAKPAADAAKPAAGAKPAGPGCPLVTKADASAALGKDTLEGQPEGADKCFFAAADTRTAPATEYVDVGVNEHESADDAKILFEATRGRAGAEPISGLGDAAVFVKEVDGGQLLALKGKTSVLVGVQSKAQADPKGALQKLASVVLAKT